MACIYRPKPCPGDTFKVAGSLVPKWNYTRKWFIHHEQCYANVMCGLDIPVTPKNTCWIQGDLLSGGSRIFPRGGRQLPKLLLFFTFLPKTAWKWKNLDPQGGGGRASLAPPLGSANATVPLFQALLNFPGFLYLIHFRTKFMYYQITLFSLCKYNERLVEVVFSH